MLQKQKKSVCDFSGQNKISNNIIQCRGYNLGQNKMGNLDLPSPQNQGWENGVLWLLRGFILDLGEVGRGFAVPFYFVQDRSFQEN